MSGCGCSSCGSDILKGCCKCGCGDCQPLKLPQICVEKCPPPPPIEPCGYRIENGVKRPVWNEYHPLIPMFMSCFAGVYGCQPTFDESFQQQLACLLNNATYIISPCKHTGQSYYQAVMLYVAATIELQTMYSLATESMYAAIANGKPAKMPVITLYDGVYGQLLRQIEESVAFFPAYVGG